MIRDINSIRDIQSEAVCVSTFIYHPEMLLTREYIQPRFFYDSVNRCLVWAVQELVNEGVTSIDIINLENKINSNNGVKNIIDKSGVNLKEFIDNCQYGCRNTNEELDVALNNVISTSYKREMYEYANNIRKECLNEERDLDSLDSFVNDNLISIQDKYMFGSDSVLFGTKIDVLWEEMKSKRIDGNFGVPSKIEALNDYFTYQVGELVLLAGATGKGKSSFFMNEVIHKLKLGIPCMVIDSELSDELYMVRMIANLSGVECIKIQRGNYNDEEKLKIHEAKDFLRKAPFVHEYLPEFNKNKVEQLCRRWKNQIGLQFVVYDYIKPFKTFGAAETSASLGSLCDFLKNVIAGKNELMVLAGIQLNQQTGTVADSQKPERYASVLALWKPKSEEQLAKDGLDCGNFLIEITKNRSGSCTGEDEYIDIRFKGSTMQIQEAQQHKKSTAEMPFD